MSGPDPRFAPAPDPDEHLAEALGAFAAAHGGRPDGVWAAPGRVNLVGEHVDYNGGPVLPVALAHRGLVAARRRDDGVLRVSSRQDEARWQGRVDALVPGTVPGWAGYAAGVVWALREAGHVVPGLDLTVDGRVPLGAGLSSSASLTCAVALAVADLVGAPSEDDTARRALAAACVRAENDFAGAPTGGMDQAAALRARAGHALLLDCRTFDAEHVPVPPDAELLVVDTRTHHALVDGRYGGRRATCERAAALLGVPRLVDLLPEAAGPAHEAADVADVADVLDEVVPRLPDDELRAAVRHVLTEVARVRAVVSALRGGSLVATGADLLASHASMRDDFRISTPELDLAVETAVAAGAHGARMTGGGFGGSAVAVVPRGRTTDVAAAVARAASRAGFRAPAFLPVTAAGPAVRVA